MFSAAYSFARRHRRKFLLAGAAAGAAGAVVLAGKYAESRLSQWQAEEQRKYLERARRRHHYESTERTGNLTLRALFPALKKGLRKALDVEDVIRRLKDNDAESSAEKVQLWHELKLLVWTRCVALLYSGACLALLLRAQLSILGGYLYQETTTTTVHGAGAVDGNANRSSKTRMTARLQEQYLALCGNFIDVGQPRLCQYLSRKTAAHVNKLTLKQGLTLRDVEQILGDIFHDVATDEEENAPKSGMCEFLVHVTADWSGLDDSENETLKKMVVETLDVLEHVEVHALVLKLCQSGLPAILDFLAENFEDDLGQNSGEDPADFVNPGEVSRPLARLLPVMAGLPVPADDDDDDRTHTPEVEEPTCRDQWLASLAESQDLRKFSANVYEAFCQSDVTVRREGQQAMASGPFNLGSILRSLALA